MDSFGKSAMVWRLNEWQGGDPMRQVAQAQQLGLDSVSLKIVDGTNECWGRNRPQNCKLLTATIAALKSEAIPVTGWGWTYGGSVQNASKEGRKAGELCNRYGIKDYWIDAEGEYHKAGTGPWAEAFCTAFEAVSNANLSLCSYRWPLTHQPKFPVQHFAPFMELWCPQVYFLGDSRPSGGAIQLKISKEQYDRIRLLPYIGVAPTYQWKSWTATGEQLRLFFEAAVEMGCRGVSVWDLPKANPEQLVAIEAFDWPDGNGTPPPQSDKERLGEIADEERGLALEIDDITDRM